MRACRRYGGVGRHHEVGESVCLGRSNEQDVLNICVSLCVALLIAVFVNSYCLRQLYVY